MDQASKQAFLEDWHMNGIKPLTSRYKFGNKISWLAMEQKISLGAKHHHKQELGQVAFR